MFVLELVFDDDEGRLTARPAHRQRLAQLYADGRLLMAGPWHDDSGALLVFRTDRDGMDEIMAADPYYTAPGVTVTALRQWQPIVGRAAMPDGQRSHQAHHDQQGFGSSQ
jgi:uncharacterized protein YciI